MRVAFVLDSPSYRAVDEGRAISQYTERFVSTLTPYRVQYFALLDAPAPKSASAGETMGRTKAAWAALEPKLIAQGFTHVVGFGPFASWLITGYTCDAAWGMPQTINGQLRWGFYNLDHILDKRGVLIPMLYTLCQRVNAPVHQNPFDRATILCTPYEALQALRKRRSKKVALDIENNPSTNQIMALGLAWDNIAISVPWDEYESGKYGWVAPLSSYSEGAEIEELIRELLRDPEVLKVGHNINHDITALERRGVEVLNTTDTLAKHHVLYPDAPHSLGFVGAQYCAIPPYKQDFKSGTEEKHVDAFVKREWHTLAVYNAKDCLTTLWADAALDREISNIPHGERLIAEQLEDFGIARQISRAGIMWDQHAADAHRIRLSEIQDKTLAFIRSFTDPFIPELNPNSTKQLREYFFKHLKIEPVKKTERMAPSLDAEALAMMQANPDPRVSHVCKAIITYREAGKFKGSYLENAEQCVGADGRVHPDVRPYGAKTGRYSIKDPAIQTIPNKMRDLYRVPEGRFLIYPDFSQLELRIAALLAGDEPMLQAFEKGIRIHTQNAMDVFQSAYVVDDKVQETLAKNVVFALNYGGTAETIQRNLLANGYNVTLEFCESLVEQWYKAHPALKVYFEGAFKRATKDLFIELPISKRRLTWWRKPRKQETANWPIQATGADIVNRAMRVIAKRIDWERTKLIGQIHDAFLIETDDVLGTCELLQEAMVCVIPVTVNGRTYDLKFSIGYNISAKGGHWANTTEYKSIEKVREAAAQGTFS